jgi:WG containing repeat
LGVIVPFDTHTLEETFFGTVGSTSSKKKVYALGSVEPDEFQDVIVRNPWVVVKQNKSWRLFEPVTKKTSLAYDSVLFKGAFAVGLRNDSAVVHFSNVKSAGFKNIKLNFIPGNDSVNFLMVTEGDRSSLYNAYAQKLFTGVFDDAAYVQQGFFILSSKGKKGLAYADGKYMIQPEYDAIGRISENVISLLKNKKFGCYDIQTKKLISPEYDKNVMLYSKQFVLAQKGDFIGFIEWDSKKINSFNFKEIKYWNDSIAWVKTAEQWMIYDISKKKILLDQIKHYEVISDTPDEKIALILHDDKYGVISSKTGILIPLEFNDIRNIGQSAAPLYMAEKHVEEASVVIVMYYDKSGRLIRRNSYSDDDYEKIYCVH